MSTWDIGKEEGQAAKYQKWHYVSLSDFSSGGFGSVLSYAWLWFMALLSVMVYAADTFTAVNLLAFNRWSGEFKPTIPLSIAKWIFAACILLSWILCGYEWFRAIRVIRKNSVSKDYLDPLAVTLQSLRVFGKEGRGWNRFLVFAELTKSKKGADYVALFTYFQFKGAVRVLLAEGPRQGVNALTLFSLMFAQLNGKNAGSDISQFWINMKTLAASEREQAVILWTMAFTFIIWVFSIVSFIAACVLYIGFLWHYIPSSDGSLSKYCRRKIERRLERIIGAKVEEALRKQVAKQERQNNKAKPGIERPQLARAPTLPSLLGKDDDAASISTTLTRTTSHNTLPLYRPPTRAGSTASNSAFHTLAEPTLPTLVDVSPRPDAPLRTFTDTSMASQSSVSSNRPLLRSAAPPGGIDSLPRRPVQRSTGQYGQDQSLPPTPIEDRAGKPDSMSGARYAYGYARPQLQRSMTTESGSYFSQPSGAATTFSPSQRRPAPQQMGLPPRPSTGVRLTQQSYEMQPPRRAYIPGPGAFDSQPEYASPMHVSQSSERSFVPSTEVPAQAMPAYSSPAYVPMDAPARAAAPSPAPSAPMAVGRSESFASRQETFRPPRRVGTAPLSAYPSTTYDTTVIDAYTSDQTAVQGEDGWRPIPRQALPRRTGTAAHRMG